MMLYEPDAFGGQDRDTFVEALQAEGISSTAGYKRPLTDEGALKTISQQHPHLVRRLPCPNVEYTCDHSVWLFQSMLLGSRSDMDDIISAITKLKNAFA
jgi:dTDP-4-amino-4,6-dideoxygalactose transaminase